MPYSWRVSYCIEYLNYSTMIPKLVTFDCAETMVRVPDNWSIGTFAVDCARHIGLKPSQEDGLLYLSMYRAKLPEFVEVNRSRDAGQQQMFWSRLALEWLKATGQPIGTLGALQLAADELGFGPDSILFKLYDDVVPCLNRLDSMGIKAAVVSNWDYSLHRVLKMFGIYERFVVVKASLEEGIEKPDPRLFEMTIAEAGFASWETVHVGDDRVDDFEGAEAAGLKALLIDRSLIGPVRPFIHSLADLPEAFDWID